MKILRHIGALAFVSFFLVSCQQLKVGKTNSNSQQQYDRTDVQGYLLPDMAGRLLSAKIQRISLGDTKTKVIRIHRSYRDRKNGNSSCERIIERETSRT